MTEQPPPREERGGGARPLNPREEATRAELRHLDPQLAYFFEQGLQLLSRLDTPGAAASLAYFGRELSRGVLRRFLDEEGLSAEDAGQVPEGEGNRASIAAAAGLQPDDPRVDEWFRLPSDFSNWLHYRSGGPPPEDVRRAFETLSDLLFGLVAPYYDTEAELDELLELQAPTIEDARRLHRVQLRAVQRSYFFGRLANPRWLTPLRQAGFFRSPPARHLETDGSWRARPWPEGGYLLKVAPQAPDVVAEVLESIPEENRNPVVWEVFAKAACLLPADVAVGLVPRLLAALGQTGARFFSESVVALVARLADAGYEQSFDLADYLLFVTSREAVGDGRDLAYGSGTAWVFPRFGWHGQEDLLEVLIPPLERLNPEGTLDLLLSKIERVQQLADALEGSGRWLLWRLDFDRSSDRDNVVAGVLEGATTLAERLAQKNKDAAEHVMSMLASYEGDVFTRLKRRVLAAAGEHLGAMLDAFLCSEEAVNPGFPAKGVALVLRNQFENASPEARTAFADAVTSGPDRSELREFLTGLQARPPSDAEIEEHVGQWQRRRLRWFRGEIPEELHGLAMRHDLLDKKPSFHEQELAEVGSYTEAGWAGIEPSPVAVEELASRSPQETAQFLIEWMPGNGLGTAEGLHATLSQFAREHSTSALGVLEAGNTLEPHWVESLLRGLREVVRGGEALEWDRIVAAVRVAIDQACAFEDMASPDALLWRRVISAGLEVVREGCGNDSVPANVLPEVWALLQAVLRSRLLWEVTEWNTPESFENVLLASWNDAAGDFAWAVVFTALRQYRAALPEGSDDTTVEARATARESLDDALVALLDAMVAERGPNAPLVRAVVGQFIPQLHLLLPDWVEANDEALFAEGVERPLIYPAWTAYVVRASLYDSVFVALRPWYVIASGSARQWVAAAGKAQGRGDVGERFASHLVVAVLRGLVSSDDPDGLLSSAFRNLEASDWGHAFWGVFRSWSDAAEPPSAAAVDRLLKLWDWRISELSALQDSESATEQAKALGWLFHTPYMPEAELVRLGRETARLSNGQLEMYSRWDRLLDLAQSDPNGAFDIGEAVMRAELRADYPHVPDDVRPFLRHALRTGSEATRARARRLIHKLGEHGYRQFRDLLA